MSPFRTGTPLLLGVSTVFVIPPESSVGGAVAVVEAKEDAVKLRLAAVVEGCTNECTEDAPQTATRAAKNLFIVFSLFFLSNTDRQRDNFFVNVFNVKKDCSFLNFFFSMFCRRGRPSKWKHDVIVRSNFSRSNLPREKPNKKKNESKV